MTELCGRGVTILLASELMVEKDPKTYLKNNFQKYFESLMDPRSFEFHIGAFVCMCDKVLLTKCLDYCMTLDWDCDGVFWM